MKIKIVKTIPRISGDTHRVPDDLDSLPPAEAYGIGHEAGRSDCEDLPEQIKITKKYLQKLIKEETQKLLEDASGEELKQLKLKPFDPTKTYTLPREPHDPSKPAIAKSLMLKIKDETTRKAMIRLQEELMSSIISLSLQISGK